MYSRQATGKPRVLARRQASRMFWAGDRQVTCSGQATGEAPTDEAIAIQYRF